MRAMCTHDSRLDRGGTAVRIAQTNRYTAAIALGELDMLRLSVRLVRRDRPYLGVVRDALARHGDWFYRVLGSDVVLRGRELSVIPPRKRVIHR